MYEFILLSQIKSDLGFSDSPNQISGNAKETTGLFNKIRSKYLCDVIQIVPSRNTEDGEGYVIIKRCVDLI
jgi:hypothetical protein